jgi:ribose transport system ATP-binding protein
MVEQAPVPILELRAISKRYGGAVALDSVDFDLLPGEVHGLIGENGAGKSTMMKLLSGVYSDYSGELLLDGQPARFASPADAQARGIGMVYQELSTFPHLTVAENLFSRRPPGRSGLIDWGRMLREARAHLRELEMDIDVTARMGELSVGTQQIIEIARVIFSGARIIMLDEPTSALSPPETRRLFEFIATLKSQGKTIIFVSHFLEDVLEVADRITVLKNSRKVTTLDARSTSKHQLVELMIGADAKILQRVYEDDSGVVAARKRREPGAVVLRVEQLSRPGRFSNISFKVCSGEILGLFGFMGAGQIQLARCLFGAEQPGSGKILLDDRALNLKNTTSARDARIAYVPENRRDTLMLGQEIYKNITLAHLGTLLRGLVNQRAEVAIARGQCESVGVKPVRADLPMLPVGALSGGNQQKIVMAKWLTEQPKLLILNEPTRGMDVGAKDEVMTIVQNLRDKGVAILLITTEPETILSVADRALVMSKGSITAELGGQDLTKENLMKHA